MPGFENDHGPIRDLAPGVAIVREGDGTLIETIEACDSPERTIYNMTVDRNRTYFADSFLVHNKQEHSDEASAPASLRGTGAFSIIVVRLQQTKA